MFPVAIIITLFSNRNLIKPNCAFCARPIESGRLHPTEKNSFLIEATNSSVFSSSSSGKLRDLQSRYEATGWRVGCSNHPWRLVLVAIKRWHVGISEVAAEHETNLTARLVRVWEQMIRERLVIVL